MNLKKAIKLRDELNALTSEGEQLVDALRADIAAGVRLEPSDPRYVRLSALSKEPGGLVWRVTQKIERLKRGS